ncbi:hypothetical protein F5Y17DRAFT_111663 [Xylariaceae sp. FL0594]|nr:hypothetical protein F5Y17DRAFT_111663 [Xylariaceae sp. FL0594]
MYQVLALLLLGQTPATLEFLRYSNFTVTGQWAAVLSAGLVCHQWAFHVTCSRQRLLLQMSESFTGDACCPRSCFLILWGFRTCRQQSESILAGCKAPSVKMLSPHDKRETPPPTRSSITKEWRHNRGFATYPSCQPAFDRRQAVSPSFCGSIWVYPSCKRCTEKVPSTTHQLEIWSSCLCFKLITQVVRTVTRLGRPPPPIAPFARVCGIQSRLHPRP